MIFYITLLFLVTCTSFVVSYGRGKGVVFVFKCITFLLISVPAAVRYGVGVDYWSYVSMFQEIKRYGLGITEIGYNLLNMWVADCGGDAQTVLALMAFATTWFFFKGVPKKRWVVYAPLFLLLIYHWYFTTVRQMFAAGLAFYAWRELQKGERVKSALAVSLACTFHYFSVMYPVLYFVSRYVCFSKRVAVVCLLAAFVLTYMYSDMLTENIIMLLTGSSSTIYSNYANSQWILETEIGSGWGLLTNYVTFAFALLCYPKDESQESKTLYTMFLIYICIMVLSTQVTILNRISRGIIFVWFPVMWNIVTGQYKYKMLWVAVIYFLLFAFFTARSINDPNLVPYKVCFNYENSIIFSH